jgi:hypothetical protein
MVVKTYDSHNGYTDDYEYYKRIKKVSMNKDKALSLYPNAIFMEDLFTKSGSFFKRIPNTRKWYAHNVFRFGKYFGENISKCTDYDYMLWYYDQIEANDDDHSNFVKYTLKHNSNHVYKTCGDYGYFISEHDHKKALLNHDNKNNLIEKLKNNEPINLGPDKNLNAYGEYTEGNVVYRFNHYKTNYYGGWPYGLPLLDGKLAKRIKFKNIIITDYTYKNEDNRIIINIENFKMGK